MTNFSENKEMIYKLSNPIKVAEGGHSQHKQNEEITAKKLSPNTKELPHKYSSRILLISKTSVLKLDSHLPKNVFLFAPMTFFNAFYFILKGLFVLKIFKFLSWLLVVCKNNLIRKIRLILKFMTSQPGYQIIAIHILPNISRIKSNQTMKFGQLKEYNKRNILLQKACRKWGRETSPRPLFAFKEALYKVKANGLQLGFTTLR